MTRKEMLNTIKEVLREEATIDKYITVISVIDGKRNLDNDQIQMIFQGDVHGTFYIYTNEEGEYENEKKVTKAEALEYIKYYNARLKRDSETEERLGAKLGVLGIESELRFNHGEISGDPTVFSLNEGPGKDYLDKAARAYFQAKDFEDAKPKPNPNDVAAYIGEAETDEIDEHVLKDFIEKNNYKEVQVAEYQFDENKYDFSKKAGAGEYDSSIIIFKVVDKSGKHILIPGDSGKKSYPYLSTTDRGILGDTYPLLEAEHVKILKSIADIFQPTDVYENYADGKVKEVFTPSPLQNIVNDYLFLVTMNFTHIEKTGKTPKDVDALTQMIRHAKSDVSKLKDLSKEQLEKNRNNILQRIHDMLTYIISRMKAHMRPEEYEKRRGRLNKLLTLYKDAASVKENYADGKVKGKSKPGRVKKSGASCKGSVSSLRAKAKKYGGEKGKMYHWCANMKGGQK